jgi:hypothetical protein
MTKLKSEFIDYSNERSSVETFVPDAILEADALDLNAAIAGMSLGTNKEAAIMVKNVILAGSSTPPSNKFAQRELKFWCKYTDTVNGKVYSFSIPCADAALVVGNTDMVDLSTGAGLDLKTEFDANCLSELGNAVSLNSVELVGRNS